MSLLNVDVREKAFGDTVILQDIQLTLGDGEAAVLLGPAVAERARCCASPPASTGVFQALSEFSKTRRRHRTHRPSPLSFRNPA